MVRVPAGMMSNEIPLPVSWITIYLFSVLMWRKEDQRSWELLEISLLKGC